MKRGFLLSKTSKSSKDTQPSSVDSKPAPAPAPASPKIVAIPTGHVEPLDTSVPFGDIDVEKVGPNWVVTWLPLYEQLNLPFDAPAVALVFPCVKEAILAIPNFPVPYKQFPSPFRISSIPGKGQGIIAISDIDPGTILIGERPLILFPVGMPWAEGAPSSFHPDRLLEAAVKKLGHAEYMLHELHNCKGPDVPAIRGIFHTNAIGIGALPGYNGSYGAVCGIISRFNHSCSPNADLRWKLDSFMEEVIAIRPIRAGEEICIQYMNLDCPRASRQEQLLAKYSFTCTCSSCSLPPKESRLSDIRRNLIHTIDSDPNDESELKAWVADPSLPDDYIIKQSQRVVEMMETEKICPEYVWPAHYQRLCKAYCALGDMENARAWAMKAARLTGIYMGNDGGWGEVASAPQNTAWWGLRKR